ncbi:hypothetical protein [Burkholderia gladioli]|uniref:hypothetical protein n=1 Tax=Burkholderia gladioli TaxID=28095 RepID=UPI0005C78E25|nr:hypothetical protein [Burkholderia gladioli]MBW5284465.1 hypothetical protein [Burkholderia gladioli]
MTAAIDLATDEEIAREHRLRHLPGPASASLTNPALRICLANCAALRARSKQPPAAVVDQKRRASGESESEE